MSLGKFGKTDSYHESRKATADAKRIVRRSGLLGANPARSSAAAAGQPLTL
jgi:hypothetical protein